MNPTDELRAQLRALLDERIPPGGSESDTRFSDKELDEILTRSASLQEAAAEGWLRKAGRAFSERGGMEETRAGNEQTRFASLKDYRDHCLRMYELYKSLASIGSLALRMAVPDVLGTGDVS